MTLLKTENKKHICNATFNNVISTVVTNEFFLSIVVVSSVTRILL